MLHIKFLSNTERIEFEEQLLESLFNKGKCPKDVENIISEDDIKKLY